MARRRALLATLVSSLAALSAVGSTTSCPAQQQVPCLPPSTSLSSQSSPLSGFLSFPNGTQFSAIALVHCSHGYEATSNAIVKCSCNGTWIGEIPSCKAIACHKELEGPSNGDVSSGGSKVYSVRAFTCNSGYAISGTTKTICLPNGTWFGDKPTCKSTSEGTAWSPICDAGTLFEDPVFITSVAVISVLAVSLLTGGVIYVRLRMQDKAMLRDLPAPADDPVSSDHLYGNMNVTVPQGQPAAAPFAETELGVHLHTLLPSETVQNMPSVAGVGNDVFPGLETLSDVEDYVCMADAGAYDAAVLECSQSRESTVEYTPCGQDSAIAPVASIDATDTYINVVGVDQDLIYTNTSQV